MKEELMELIRNMVADDEMELTEDSESGNNWRYA